MSKHVGDFSCFNCLHHFNLWCCGVNRYQKFHKTSSIIHKDLKSLIKRIVEYKNNFENYLQEN